MKFLFMRKVFRKTPWVSDTWGAEEQADTLGQLWDRHVKEHGRLSIWRAETDDDMSVILAITAEAAVDSGARCTQHHFQVPEEWLVKLDFIPQHTPQGTGSSHARASELHYDLVGMNESRCRRLRDALREDFSNRHCTYAKAEVRRRVKGQIEFFNNDTTRARLSADVAGA